ncbi:MAG: response regulator [Rhodospirillales bacterium]|nr:response regulator [Rhodospirillales bacterium]MCB9996879.1 response regulator [Rhodospirillales bacterium]
MMAMETTETETKRIPQTEDQCLSILLIEDSEADGYMVRRTLGKHMKQPCRIHHVESMRQAQQFLENDKNRADIVLLDLGLPDTRGGRDTYERLLKIRNDIPVIILTGTDDHALAVQIVDEGAEDFVRKAMMSVIPESLCDAIDFAMCRHNHVTTIREEKDREVSEKEQVIQWMSGGYSVD